MNYEIQTAEQLDEALTQLNSKAVIWDVDSSGNNVNYNKLLSEVIDAVGHNPTLAANLSKDLLACVANNHVIESRPPNDGGMRARPPRINITNYNPEVVNIIKALPRSDANPDNLESAIRNFVKIIASTVNFRSEKGSELNAQLAHTTIGILPTEKQTRIYNALRNEVDLSKAFQEDIPATPSASAAAANGPAATTG